MILDLSIIIPVFNTQDFLVKCLDSCLTQSNNSLSFEIIIIDDGSTDDSISLIKTYADKFHNVKFIKQANQKQGAARNRALEIANGKYFWFIDSDDWIDNKAFEVLEKHVHCGELDVLRFGAADHYPEGLVVRNNSHLLNKLYQKNEVLNENVFTSSTPFYLFKKSFLDKNSIKFIEGIFFEDNDFVLNVFLSEPIFQSISDTLYYVRIRPNSTTRSKDYYRYMDIVIIIELMVEKLNNGKIEIDNYRSIINLIGRNMNSVLFGTLPSQKAFKDGTKKIKKINGLKHFMLSGSSKKYKLQFMLLDYPIILRCIMLVFYKFKKPVSNV